MIFLADALALPDDLGHRMPSGDREPLLSRCGHNPVTEFGSATVNRDHYYSQFINFHTNSGM